MAATTYSANNISELQAAQFEDFFWALWGSTPFAWQCCLAARVLSPNESLLRRSPTNEVPATGLAVEQSSWPEAIALPTASGKTACVDIAVFALAAQASRLNAGQPITAPRRIFFVVDRRIIVDEAYERARRIAQRLAKAEDGILKMIRDNLLHICRGGTNGLGGEQPLAVHVLRGGMYRSEGWARSPLQPTIVASTVDQIGSRLLFRAYGRGPGTWPIYAGLVANDSLILLDEAHCSQPFLQTLQAVCKYRAWAQEPLGRCFHPVVMSATPPTAVQDIFRDTSGEGANANHPLGKRQLASKPARLRAVARAKGKRAISELSKELAKAAKQLLAGGRQAIVVFVNRVAAARETSRLLGSDPNIEVVLLTGRMRAIDKDRVVRQLERLQLHSDRSASRNLEVPVIVVATQTLEVGADLDFDGLVTECASLDALRQRFGRLNRMGRTVEARAEILIRADQVAPKRDDPVYGSSLTATWEWLKGQENENGEIDFGIAALEPLISNQESLAKLNAPTAEAPIMLPAHVDCWSQTNPEPWPSPDVELFLRGSRNGAPDVQVCWRADLDLSGETTRDESLESLILCPPSSVETLPVPIGMFRRWLQGTETNDESADIEGLAASDWLKQEAQSELMARRVVRWRGGERDGGHITANPPDIRPGDIVVIPASHPGSWRALGDLPLDDTQSVDALDIGDQAHRIARAKPILRLHPNLVRNWPDSLTAKEMAKSLLDDDLGRRYEEDPDVIVDAVLNLLGELARSRVEDDWSWLPLAAKELKEEYSSVSRLRRVCRLMEGRSLILEGRKRIESLAQAADAFGDEDDAASCGISHRKGEPVRLRSHLPGVETFGRLHAAGCGLPEHFVHAIARAGLLHDVGKADPRFQSLLNGGLPWVAGEPLAKSREMPLAPADRYRARKASGYPAGGRHELLSVRMAEKAPALLPDSAELRDLVLHLVASHHGYCRPFAPVVEDEEPVVSNFQLNGYDLWWRGPTRLERLDSGVADRYWRLIRRYGWWGLAWLEALLRLADWRRSEWEETHDPE